MREKCIILLAVVMMVVSAATYQPNRPTADVNEIPIEIDKIVNDEKYNAYLKLRERLDFASEGMPVDKKDEYDENLTQAFGEQVEGYKHVGIGSPELSFYFEMDDYLSKSNIPALIESAGASGTKEFIACSEQSFRTLKIGEEDIWRSNNYFHYDPKTKSVFSYYISAPSRDEKPNRVSLQVSFRETLTYPNDYMKTIQGIENEQIVFSNYFVGGNTDMIIFENVPFIQYIDMNIGRFAIKDEKISSYPLKAWLYGKEGRITALTLAYVKPEQALFENANVENMEAFLDALGLTQDDKEMIKEKVQNALAYDIDNGKGKVGAYSYTLHTISEDSYYGNRAVEVTIQ